MLSQENINKLCMTGLYICEPNKEWRSSLYWDDMYHCCNWTFRVHKYGDGRYFMYDTYWSDNAALHIELTDKNINEFQLLFDFNDVNSHSGKNIYDYDQNDWFHVAIDSGGLYCGGKYFVKNTAIPNKDKVLKRLEDEIKGKENDIEYIKRKYELVLKDETDLRYV